MKTITITTALILASIASFSQSICPSSFKRNNGNGSCGALGELRLNFLPACPANAPIIDSVYVNGVNTNVTFNLPDMSHCGGGNGYISYCVTSGNMPPANVWKIYFHVGGTSYDCMVPSTNSTLAVKYHSFDASISGNSITCKWVTEEEINNNYFELQRSFDGTNFSNIAIIFSAENNVGTKQYYQFKDNSTVLNSRKVVYYRLKQVDKDGTASYSKVLTVRSGTDNANNLQVFPNPFVKTLTVKVEAAEAGISTTKVIDIAGQAVVTEEKAVVKGSNNLQMTSLNNLPKGMYFLQVSVNGVLSGNQKIIKN